MIDDFPCYLQQTNWSCLPTAVFSVLEHLGHPDVNMDQVADWCQVLSGGACRWDDSIESLRASLQEQQGAYDVINLEGDWAGLREAVQENDESVIASIANPSPQVELVGGHAVVVIRFEVTEGGEEQVVYMDPSCGTYEHKTIHGNDGFLEWWSVMGQLAFLLRP